MNEFDPSESERQVKPELTAIPQTLDIVNLASAATETGSVGRKALPSRPETIGKSALAVLFMLASVALLAAAILSFPAWRITIGSVVSIAILLWWLPRWQTEQWTHDGGLSPKERFEIENSARDTLSKVVGGLFVLYSLYFTWQSLLVSEQGQITDRYTKAIDQLASVDSHDKPKIWSRLGAIYALERIAHDSPRDHWPIINILAAYARRRSRDYPVNTSPEEDVQAVLDVLSRRTDVDLESSPIVLTGSNLTGLTLRRTSEGSVHFEFARFDGAYLYKTGFAGTNLVKASFTSAEASGANFEGAHLAGTNFRGSILEQALLMNTDLKNASLDGAILTDANLQGADLRGADLHGADLRGADLRKASVSDAQIASAITGQSVTGRSTQLPPELSTVRGVKR